MEKTGNDYSCSRVPPGERCGLFTVAIIRIGATTALGQFLIGAMLGHSLTFYQALLATLLGSLILEFVSFGLGVAASREGLSTSLLARWCGFGQMGSVLIGVLIAVSLLGWFGVQNAMLAKGLDFAFEGKLGFAWAAVLSGMTITLLVSFGFRALGWIAFLAVPLFFLVVGWIALDLVWEYNPIELIFSVPSGEPMSIGFAATVVAGGCIVGAVSAADMGRYCQNGKHVFWMITSSILVGEFVVNIVAILIAHALDTSDVLTAMTHTAGWVGLLALVLSAIKVNDLNLYSSSLAIVNAVQGISGRQYGYKTITLVLGICGTGLSVLGILDGIQHFLILLGVVFPPIAGVMLCDYYILRTSRAILDHSRAHNTLPPSTSTPAIGWNAIVACLVGTAVGVSVDCGIASLNSLLTAVMVYGVLGLAKLQLAKVQSVKKQCD
ncbi:cytosine permease [Acerihabitans sp. TG2]|uniref:cytosine permease n=1 Tax=Acerihabitans sp. TG2 TaxID=3096008 RepID=UPI002B22D29A|nr:cytosine permease [Acerihabitans sp. TG2]MEA9391447.1 cytosine permease [Acerihabitans sp. TG2]